MSERKPSVPFSGTKEQEKALLAVIEEMKDTKGALIPILQGAQEIYGYLPYEVQKIVCRETKIPLEEIYGVVSFYSFFTLNPKGKYKVSVCLGTACYVKNAGEIFERISCDLGVKSGECTPDAKFSLDACRCIGACGLAPVLTVNDDVYGRVEVDDIKDILDKYKNA